MKREEKLNRSGRTNDPDATEGFDLLAELALDLRWSWSHSTDEIWQQLDPALWELTRNPWVILQSVARARLDDILRDPVFRHQLDEFVKIKREQSRHATWFERQHGTSGLKSVAYFSMEFMLSEALPIYSGGLGNVAGDQLKAASDLGVPVVGVGLLYQQGYFRQIIGKNGEQQAWYPYNDPSQLPITPLRKPDGQWLRLEIELPGYSVWLRAWQAQVGSVRLLLLDTNDAANFPAHRGITSELYGGGSELRLKQEMVLGIGGWRLLRELGMPPQVCHLNEGHAAFAILERAADFMAETGQPFHIALAVTRAGNLFTTHTAVAAGFDRFSPDLIYYYLAGYAQKRLGLSGDELLALGRLNGSNPAEPFNMAYLALRGCGAANGVSRLHGEVSRELFSPLYPRWPQLEIPVGHVTNGVHVPSWDSEAADGLWTKACGKDRWRKADQTCEPDVRHIDDEELWNFRNEGRRALIDYARRRLTLQRATSGASSDEVEAARTVLEPGVLTLGFARRFATYKRPNLLLFDPERLIRLLTDSRCPVQLIIAGKAHPADAGGQALIKEWTGFIRRPEVQGRVIFLSDYDMSLTEHLVQGVDVWLNTPRRPWEASGTSGMKVLVNGGINLSELDGWWAEAYRPEVGWALGDGREHGDDPAWDRAEAEQLFDLLESQVAPEFYDRDSAGLPRAWIGRVRESMATLTAQFSANRTVREYTEHYYIPAARKYNERAAAKAEVGGQIAEWLSKLKDRWSLVRFGTLEIDTRTDAYRFMTEVFLNGLNPDEVRVELYAEGGPNRDKMRQEMKPDGDGAGHGEGHWYTAIVPANRPADDYTPRIIPHRPGVAVPLEANYIIWQR